MPTPPAPAKTAATAADGDSTHPLQCMQVWGDNRAADSGVVMPGLDAWVHSSPAGTDDAGGDVYYVSSCATGRIVRLLVADVAGHGADVATIASKLRTLMRRHMNQPDQRKLLRQINREFLGHNRLGQFATAVVISCWTPTGELTVSIAGHPSPVRYRAATGGWESLFAAGEHANLPLGIDEDAEFQQVKVRLEANDMLMAFSDGLIESRDSGGAMLEQHGLIGLLNTLEIEAGRGPELLVRSVVDKVADRRNGAAGEDDTTVLLMRPNELRPRASVLSGLMAGFRVMKGSLGRPRAAPLPEVTPTNMLGAFNDRFNSPRR